jgi:hypothetical protein
MRGGCVRPNVRPLPFASRTEGLRCGMAPAYQDQLRLVCEDLDALRYRGKGVAAASEG